MRQLTLAVLPTHHLSHPLKTFLEKKIALAHILRMFYPLIIFFFKLDGMHYTNLNHSSMHFGFSLLRF